ncbi:MAG: hypothetical protein ACKO04_07310, partial [Actinomycetes bacterium]
MTTLRASAPTASRAAGTTVEARSEPPARRAVLGALAIGVVVGTWPDLLRLLGVDVSSTVREVVAATVQTVAAGTGGVLALTTARRGRPELRRAWTFLGLALLAWALGNVAYVTLALGGTEPAVPSVADVGYLLWLPLLAVGVFAWPTDLARRTDVGALLDGLICATAVLLLLWIGIFESVSASGTSSLPEVVVSLAYPLVDIVVLLMLVVAVRRTRPGNRSHLLLLTGGLGAVLLA